MLVVTTPLEETFSTTEEMIFLGEWCKNNPSFFAKNNVKYHVLAEPWSDRKRRRQAYDKTWELYEKFIVELACILNHAHGIKMSVRCWKIICGPWLKMYINASYHFWECTSDLKAAHNITSTIFIRDGESAHVPKNMPEFEEKITQDHWNHYLCSMILRRQFKDIEIVETESKLLKIKPDHTASVKRRAFVFFMMLIGKFINRNNSYFVMNSYLPKIQQLILGLRLMSFPCFNVINDLIPHLTFNSHWRKKLKLNSSPSNDYERFLEDTIISNIPLVYLEGFRYLQKVASSNGWPESPSVIVTAASHITDDIFKVYAASKVALGSKLKLICHGGLGKHLYSDFQKHELDICDSYFTWGWSEYSSKCVKGFLIKETIKRKKDPGDYFVQVLLGEYKYVKSIGASPSYDQFINHYINDQIEFIANLDMHVRPKGLVKLGHDDEIHVEDKLAEKFTDIKIVAKAEDFPRLLRSARLIVTTYNATTLVESLASDVPTIAFWNPDCWEMVSSADKIFNSLRLSGIYHESPLSAARHLNSIWDDVDAWWKSRDVQCAVKEFLAVYGRVSNKPVSEIMHFIKN